MAVLGNQNCRPGESKIPDRFSPVINLHPRLVQSPPPGPTLCRLGRRVNMSPHFKAVIFDVVFLEGVPNPEPDIRYGFRSGVWLCVARLSQLLPTRGKSASLRITSTAPCEFFSYPGDPFLHELIVIYLHSVERGSNGAWQKFERGELPLFPFYEEFSRDLSDTANGNVWYAAYCKRRGIGVSVSSHSDSSIHYESDCPELPERLNVDGREVSVLTHRAS